MTPLADIAAEADRLVEAAQAEGVPIRLIGGLAVRLQAGDSLAPPLRRDYKDIDLATLKGRGSEVARFMVELGYEADAQFNALHGDRRLLLYDTEHQR